VLCHVLPRGLEKFLEVAGAPAPIACLECWLKGHKLGRSKVIYPGPSTWLPSTHALRISAAGLNKPSEAAPPRTAAPRMRTTLERKQGITALPADTCWSLRLSPLTFQPTCTKKPLQLVGHPRRSQQGTCCSKLQPHVHGLACMSWLSGA
jgi:hypothetical protein